jgi:hypothetical protein
MAKFEVIASSFRWEGRKLCKGTNSDRNGLKSAQTQTPFGSFQGCAGFTYIRGVISVDDGYRERWDRAE